MNPQVIWLLLIGAGVLWFVLQQKKTKPIDADDDFEMIEEEDLSRVEVFAMLDKLSEWFDRKGSEPGYDAIRLAHHALVEDDDGRSE